MFKIGFLVNPFAGAGGPSALKGSDAPSTKAAIVAGKIEQTASHRAALFLESLQSHLSARALASEHLRFYTPPGEMGEQELQHAGYKCTCIDYQPATPSTADDTRRATAILNRLSLDLLVFVGGDGTARDVCEASAAVECGDHRQLAVGVPAGVKMQSAVFAISPNAAAQLVVRLIAGDMVGVAEREVRDLDEEAYKTGQVRSRYFGTLWVPDEPQFVQAVKQGGLESEPLVVMDIADQLEEWTTEETLVLMGPGSTTHQVAQRWEAEKTLLGVDGFRRSGEGLQCTHRDLNEQEIIALLDTHNGECMLVLTVMGGQGHIVGRGNQQLSAAVLKRIGRHRTKIIATRTKLQSLEGRPLLVDSGDPDLDSQWRGRMPVLTGFDDQVLYPVGYDAVGCE